jgi:hypothetical protein
MNAIVRVLVGAGLFAFGYYLGKQVGMLEPIRMDLARARERAEGDEGGNAEREQGAAHEPRE